MREFRRLFLSPGMPLLALLLLNLLDLRAADQDLASERSSQTLNVATNAKVEPAIPQMRLPPGFTIELVAAEPMIANPVSLAFDERGRAYVVETHRRASSVYDIRAHPNWLDADSSFRSVSDRANFFQKVLVPENNSLPENIRRDLNRDGRFDHQDLTVESERIRLLEDRNADGRADFVTTFAEGFNTRVSGVAGSVLGRGSNVWFNCIPDLWLLKDANNDGLADSRRALLQGFGVHIGLGGHDLHGLALGPDGKIYLSMGDRGCNIATQARSYVVADTGAILRCNPDGSDFEVIATGLRNPQDLAFDQFGNLWTVENCGDEEKGAARLVFVIDGADGGWHAGWQHLPNLGAWNEEKLCEIPPANLAAHVLPPVAHVGRAPAGFAFYPGTGLPTRYDHHLFFGDSPDGILSFSLQPKGAAYEVVDLHQFLRGLHPVDVDFAPSAGVYVLDSARGVDQSGQGRIYRVYDPAGLKDAAALEAKKILAEGMLKRSPRELVRLLEHRDRRVRQEAQFALADKGVAATNLLFRAAWKNDFQLARLHAIWALGQIGRTNSETLSSMLALLADADAEVRAQAARVLGDGRLGEALEPLARLLLDASPRVQLFAALGLGKLGRQEATEPILHLLRDNGDRDPYLRHAGVMALVWLNDMNALLAAAKESSSSVRMGVLLAMRRLARPEIAMFLYDSNLALVLEAARAIYDLPIDSAFSQLAVMAGQSSKIPALASEANGKPAWRAAILRRALNANFRLGKLENALLLAEFAAKKDAPAALRAEALQLFAQWPKPSHRDPLLGLWRPLPAKDSRSASLALRADLPNILRNAPNPVRIAAIAAAVQLEISTVTPVLTDLVANTKLPSEVRLEALKGLGALKASGLADAASLAAGDPDEALRKEAGRWLAQFKPADPIGQIAVSLERGTVAEKQSALASLATISGPVADQIVAAWLDLLSAGKVPKELQLDLLEVARQRPANAIRLKIEQYETSRPAHHSLAQYREVLHGGNSLAGRRIFFERPDPGCARCHRVQGSGGDLGPDLTGIGAQRSREHILESILFPDQQISAGFENLKVTMKSGRAYAGRIKNETERELLLISTNGGFLVLGKNQIQSRERGVSSMPADAGKLLSKRELRDLVEYLATLR